MVVATLIGVAVFGGWAAVQAAPYLRVADDHPEAVHSVGAVTHLSPPPAGLLTAPPGNLIWGRATAPRRATLVWPSEQELFPGVLVLTFAAMGLFTPILGTWRRVVLVIAIGLTVMLSMGFRSPLPGLYKFAYDHAPGWKGIRTPGRLTTITTLALGLIAAGGVQWLANHVRKRTRAVVSSALCITLVGGVLVEGAGSFPIYTPPPAPAARQGLASPQMHLPSDPNHDMHYMLWSVGDFPKIANGHAIFVPRAQARLRLDVAGFPDARSIQLLRAIGVKVVIWHRAFAPGTPWANVDVKPIAGLGITKREAGDIVIFDLPPEKN